MPNYTVVNAKFDYKINDKARAYLKVDNVFDKEYQVINTYGTSDRAAYLGFSFDF